MRGEGRIAGCGPRPSGLPWACPQGCPVTRSYPFKFGGAGGKHRTKRRLHATAGWRWAWGTSRWRSRRLSAEEVEEPFIADMLRTEGAALRHTAGVTREPAPNLVGLPCAPGSALSCMVKCCARRGRLYTPSTLFKMTLQRLQRRANYRTRSTDGARWAAHRRVGRRASAAVRPTGGGAAPQVSGRGSSRPRQGSATG